MRTRLSIGSLAARISPQIFFHAVIFSDFDDFFDELLSQTFAVPRVGHDDGKFGQVPLRGHYQAADAHHNGRGRGRADGGQADLPIIVILGETDQEAVGKAFEDPEIAEIEGLFGAMP